MNLTVGQRKMIEDATKAGFTVIHQDHRVRIVKHANTWRQRGLWLSEDGTAIDLSVRDLTVAKNIRRLRDMRAVLGI